MSAACSPAAPVSNWQTAFLAMLPALERQARRAVATLPVAERDEARQFIVASSAVAFARLAQLNRAELAYPGPLARYGLQHYRAGRLLGGSTNSQDVTSTCCQRQVGCTVESLDDWQETLPERCTTTPAELAALRVDFANWLKTLSARDQRLARTLAAGEETGAAAKLFGITAGRVSQLRRELYQSWQRFVGEAALA